MPVPSTPLLDTFGRPDQSPLSTSGLWARSSVSLDNMQLINGEAALIASLGIGMCTWLPGDADLFDCEAYVTRRSSAGSVLAILRMPAVSGVRGYSVELTASAVGINRHNSALSSTPLASQSFAAQIGDTALIRAAGPALVAYVIRGSTIMQVASATDATYASGRLAIGLSNEAGRLSNFGGGAIDSLSQAVDYVGGFGAC